jgi:L-rhamnose isomerase/sugar isomerase
MSTLIDASCVEQHNAGARANVEADYAALGGMLERRGQDIEQLTALAQTFAVALPSWGVGTGGTRFARFPGAGEPRNVFEKLADCAVIHQLTRATPTVSLHFPWDKPGDPGELLGLATSLGLGFDTVNSNTFQDQQGQDHTYKFGSLTSLSAQARAHAVGHNIECIELGKALGSKGLTVWVGDGSNFPGQHNLRGALERWSISNTSCSSPRSTRPPSPTGAPASPAPPNWARRQNAWSTSDTTRPTPISK